MARGGKRSTRTTKAEPEAQPAATLPVRAKDDEPLDKLPAAQGNLTVFGDDSDADADVQPKVTPSVAKSQADAEPDESEEDSDDDDDDEAPEAVSTQAAASLAKQSTQAAQKKAQQQAATQKRKRQERDALFKQQAEERKKAEVENEAALTTTAAPATGDAQAPVNGRKRMDRMHIPSVLPAEFLTDSSSESEDGGDDAATLAAGPKRRKVATVERQLTRLDRGPKDERVGSTLYRVAKKTDDRLAPKSKKYAQSTRASLQSRNRTPTASRGGFLRR